MRRLFSEKLSMPHLLKSHSVYAILQVKEEIP